MIRVLLWLIAALSIAVPALVVRFAPPVIPSVRHHGVVLPPRRVVPAAELPPVEPLKLVDLSPDEARAFNADVPFVEGPNPAARPFRFAGSDIDRARAVDCLAAAALYEAGDDTTGEKAVAQVVLNRLRHPAFPKSVCGVVFEGSERTTGCQFTFTCDGALIRRAPSSGGWARAQQVAAAALGGEVFAPVGYATHYHTDWVVPYWQSSLDKIAKVGTHLFFRWTGWWGTPPAFNRHPTGGEPVIAALSPLTGSARQELVLDAATMAAPAGAEEFEPVAGDPNSFLVTLPPGVAPALYPELAGRACGERAECKFSGWSDKAKTPAILPLQSQQIAAMTFAYLRDRSAGLEKTLWNCEQVPRPDRSQCMKAQIYQPTAAPAPVAMAPAGSPPVSAKGPPALEGVRRAFPPLPPMADAPPPSPAKPNPTPGKTAKPTANPHADPTQAGARAERGGGTIPSTGRI